MKKIELSLNYEKILKRIELDKDRFKVGKWAELLGVSISTVSNIHSKQTKVNPSMEYIIAVARAMGKPIEWYLYGEMPVTSPMAVSEEKVPYNAGPKKESHTFSPEILPYCILLEKVLESDDEDTKVAIKSNLLAFKISVNRDVTIKDQGKTIEHQAEIIKDQGETISDLNKRLSHIEKLLDPAGSPTGTDEAE